MCTSAGMYVYACKCIYISLHRLLKESSIYIYTCEYKHLLKCGRRSLLIQKMSFQRKVIVLNMLKFVMSINLQSGSILHFS